MKLSLKEVRQAMKAVADVDMDEMMGQVTRASKAFDALKAEYARWKAARYGNLDIPAGDDARLAAAIEAVLYGPGKEDGT